MAPGSHAAGAGAVGDLHQQPGAKGKEEVAIGSNSRNEKWVTQEKLGPPVVPSLPGFPY